MEVTDIIAASIDEVYIPTLEKLMNEKNDEIELAYLTGARNMLQFLCVGLFAKRVLVPNDADDLREHMELELELYKS